MGAIIVSVLSVSKHHIMAQSLPLTFKKFHQKSSTIYFQKFFLSKQAVLTKNQIPSPTQIYENTLGSATNLRKLNLVWLGSCPSFESRVGLKRSRSNFQNRHLNDLQVSLGSQDLRENILSSFFLQLRDGLAMLWVSLVTVATCHFQIQLLYSCTISEICVCT